jgi:hypothetical protein
MRKGHSSHGYSPFLQALKDAVVYPERDDYPLCDAEDWQLAIKPAAIRNVFCTPGLLPEVRWG